MAPEGRRWHLLERLGSGAFGEVYLAEQDSGAGFRRRVALKLLHPHVATLKEAGRRMRDEARILGRLSHRHIVTVLDLVRVGEQWAIVMDYVPGVDLDRLLESLERAGGSVPAPAALEIGAAIAEAMDAAWNADDGKGTPLRVVHRDIKPSNVLVTRDGDVKVLDFGVARVNNLESRESRTGLRVGTELYMSPQRICGEEDELAGDVYALGATLCELLVGQPIGRTPVNEDKHAAFVEALVPEVKRALTGPEACVDAVADLLRSSLDADAAKRPDARAMADELARLARRLEGDGLVAFARVAVPRADEILGTTREPVEGVLSEHHADRTGGVTSWSSPPTAGATVDVDALEPPSRVTRWIAAAIGVALGSGIAVGVVAGIGVGEDREAPPRAEPDVAAAAVQAPVAAPPEPTPVAQVAPPPPPVVAEPLIAPVPRPIRPKPARALAPPLPERPPEPTPAPAADAPKVSRALFVMRDASSLVVRCGDVTSRGTASVRITTFPAGACQVTATWLDRELSAEVTVDRPREVVCSATGEALSCS